MLDLIYARTRLLRDAESAGCATSDGGAALVLGLIAAKVARDVLARSRDSQRGQAKTIKVVVAKVLGTSNTAVEWKVSGKDQGEVSDSGLYSTPAVMTTCPDGKRGCETRLRTASAMEVSPSEKKGPRHPIGAT